MKRSRSSGSKHSGSSKGSGRERIPDVDGVYRLHLPAANTNVEANDLGLTPAFEPLGGETRGCLIFGGDVKRGLRKLSNRADVTRCWQRDIGALRRLSVALRKGGGALGVDRLKWLHSQGIAASRESDRGERSRTEAAKRTFHDGTSRRVFDLHTKPKNATGPDCCVRIYFDIAADGYTILIGWIGRHP